METQVVREATPSALGLSKIHLHIENVVPHDSLTTNESNKQQQLQLSREEEEDAWKNDEVSDRMAWMRGFKVTKKGGGLQYLDQESLKKQQGVVKDVMKQVGSQLLTGKLAVRISLPIRIFEPRSLLERVADGWNYAPTLLRKAGLVKNDPLERMKLVMAFVMGGFHFCVGQLKPFNPIVGETYEATYADGTRVFMEHVGQHPVASAFNLSGPGGLYEMSGVYEFESVTSRNSIFNHQIGHTRIAFSDGHVITYKLPQIKMSGILFGERIVELAGVASFLDETNQLVGELNCDHSSGFLFSKSHSDDLKGQIAHMKTKKILSSVHGSWLTHLNCDGKTYWQVETEPVFTHRPVDDPLPSDCRFREDLIALKKGDWELAQREKVRLEELQRTDRKLREEHSNLMKHSRTKSRRASRT